MDQAEQARVQVLEELHGARSLTENSGGKTKNAPVQGQNSCPPTAESQPFGVGASLAEKTRERGQRHYLSGVATPLQTVSVKLPESVLVQIGSRKRSAFVRQAVLNELNRQPESPWKPATPAGRKRAALRAAFIKRGGELLDCEGIAAELRARRGGLA